MSGEILINLLMVLFGLVGLYFGAEWLVKGSVDLALCFNVSALVIGLTVVAFGTSAPEAFIGVSLNMSGYPASAIGNVIGSNICNIALMLGIAAILKPVQIKPLLMKRDMPLLIVFTIVFIAMFWDKGFAKWEGIVLFTAILIYVIVNVRLSRKPGAKEIEDEFRAEDPVKKEEARWQERTLAQEVAIGSIFILLGLLLLVVSAESLKRGAVSIAQMMGVSEAIIGLTLVALGTSLPEIATAVVASLKNHGDIISGNAVGSCIFNICAVMGIVIIIKPITGIEGIKMADLGVMLGVVLLVTPFMMTGKKIARWEGLLLVLAYIGYCVYLVQRGGIELAA